MKNVFAKLLEFLSLLSLPVTLKKTKGFLKSRLLSFEQPAKSIFSLMYYIICSILHHSMYLNAAFYCTRQRGLGQW